jgi:DNA-directed RNA polymerase specialized sigma24 family protein
MDDLSRLNGLYQEYLDGGMDRRELEGKMFGVILDNARNYHWFNSSEEESVDYLCWAYPRISRAIRQFKDSGSAFSTYIGAIIRYSMKEYRGKEMDRSITEYAAWTTHNMDMEVRNPEFGYPGPGEEETEQEPPRTGFPALFKSRQILLLILKSYYHVSEDFVERIAPYTGLKTETLKLMIEKLRSSRVRKEEEIRRLQERINTQFYRCIAWEKRLQILPPESSRHQIIRGQLEKARRRLESMRGRYARLRKDATHRQIAEVTGISTGTVSSGFSILRAQWRLDREGRPVEIRKKEKKSGPGAPASRGKEKPPGGGREGFPPL